MRLKRWLVRPIAMAVSGCFAPAWSNPTVPQIVSGSASFQRPDARTLNVTNSPGAIIHWQGFSIGAKEITRFIQQSSSSAVLNRVVGADISRINGQLLSNGRVFLINPAGILIGGGAVIDTAGFVASTLNMTDADFLAGKLRFQGNGAAGSITNQGWIKTSAGGNVILVAPRIENAGLIETPGGELLLAAGQKLTIGSFEFPGVQFEIQAPGDAVLNVGKLIADGGAVGVFAGTLKHSGDIRANALTRDEAGRIVLKAQGNVTVAAGSTTRADGNTGGKITIQSGDTALVSGDVSAAGAAGRGGTVQILGERVGLIDSVRVNVSGALGGGAALIGGDYKGLNPNVQNASGTFIGADASIAADATAQGDGGRVIVWANEATRVHGGISARGAGGGNGGFVETSGQFLDVTRAPDIGAGGTWLLDPRNIEVVSSANSNNSGAPSFTPTGDNSQINNLQINGQLDGGVNVVLDTGSLGTQAGNITVNAPITQVKPAGGGLVFNAQNDVTINENITLLTGAFNVTTLNSGGTMTVNRQVTVGSPAADTTGSMNLNLAGGLVVQSSTANSASLFARSGQTVTARSLAVTASGSGGANITNQAGTQSITINNGGSGSGIDVIATGAGGASISHGFVTCTSVNPCAPLAVGAQNITVNNGDRLRVLGTGATAFIQSGTSQNILLQGSGQNSIELGSAGAVASSQLFGFNQSVTAGTGAQSGSITLIGGVNNATAASIFTSSSGSTQTVNTTGTISATGGTGTGPDGADAGIRHNGSGLQTISAQRVVLQGGSAGDDSNAFFNTFSGSQQITVGSGGINLTGGSGGIDTDAHITMAAPGAAQSITVNGGGSITLQGGSSSGSANQARIQSDGASQTINFTSGGNIVMTGGMNGTLNVARIRTTNANSTQTIDGATGITMTGGASGGGFTANGTLGNFAQIRSEGSQTISVGAGGITLTGGGGSQTDNFANIYQASPGATRQQTITVSGGGTIALTGGSSAAQSAGTDGSGSFAFIRGDGGSGQSINFTTPGAINITGGTVGTGNSAGFRALNGPQTIAGSPSLTMGGGSSGGITNDANSTTILADVGSQSITASTVTLNGAPGGIANSSTIRAPSQSITINGDLTLNGNTGGTGGGGTRIGGNPDQQTSLALTVGGNLTLNGGITGAGVLGTANNNTTVQTTNLSLTVGGNLALNPGSGAAPRIGQPSNLNGGGNIAITAGNVSLRGNAAGQASIRTGGDIALTAANISVHDSAISAGGVLSATASGAFSIVADTARSVVETTGAGGQAITSSSLSLQGAPSGTSLTASLNASAGQAITAGAGGITLTGGGGTGNSAQIQQLGTNSTQAITVGAAGSITLQGGSGAGANNQAQISQSGTSQSIASQDIQLTGGTNGTLNIARIRTTNPASTQNISASNGITLTGGASGGGFNANGSLGNFAQIRGEGDQTISVGAGGITMTGGGGSQTDNFASITQVSTTVARQQNISLGSGGSIVLQGGSSAAGVSADASGSFANISANGGAQSINFTAGSVSATGVISISGGTVGANNSAGIFSNNNSSTQTIIGVRGIALQGGASGGAEGTSTINSFGNSAQVRGNGSQEITVGSGGITATGGSGNADNFAQVRQGPVALGNAPGPGTHQTLTLNNGGNITLRGGSTSAIATANGNGSYGRIRGEGDTQTINFTSGGAISITGGTVGSSNHSQILSNSGAQIITGSPSVTMVGGASGGATDDGNFARIRSGISQTFTLGSLQLTGSAGGIDNFTVIDSPVQNITINGNLSLTGPTGGSGSIGARIGGIRDGATNLTLNVGGALALNGGSVAGGGATLGPSGNSVVAQPANINVIAGADITLNPGSAAGARVGHPSDLVAAGDIAVTSSGGNIVLGGNASNAATIRTTGNVTLGAAAAGKSISQAGNSVIQAATLSASANAGIALNGVNEVTTFSASNTGTNGAQFTQAAGSAVTVSGIAQSGGDVMLTADDMNITGGINVGAATARLRPTTVSRNVNIENAATANTLSLSPTELAFVTAGSLEVGRSDSTGTLTISSPLTSTNINAQTLRFFGNDLDVNASIGSSAAPLNANLELRAANNANVGATAPGGSIFLADNRNLTIVADNDASGAGRVSIGGPAAQTLRVGTGVVNDSSNTTGSMRVQGADVVLSSARNSLNVEVFGDGNQTFNATNSLVFGNGSNAALRIESGGSQTFATTSGNMAMGASTAPVSVTSDTQAITLGGTLTLTGGTANNASAFLNGGNQTISATGIDVRGGGGANVTNAFARINSSASQTLTVGAGGINLTGGTGSGGATNNRALITQANTAVATSQNITVNSGGSIVVQGGSSAGGTAQAGGSDAGIIASGGTQSVTFTSGGAIGLTGGTVGARNDASLRHLNLAGTQRVTGVTGITVRGGASGGLEGTSTDSAGNFGSLRGDGTQEVTVGSGGITLIGGAGNFDNFAQVRQGPVTGVAQPGSRQTITVNGGGSITLQGGSQGGTTTANGNGSSASLRGEGEGQTLNFTSGGAIVMTGGSVGTSNEAGIRNEIGPQTISGSPNLTMLGGSSGGAADNGNYARIRSGVSQNFTLGTVQMTGGSDGVDNFASIQAPLQTITSNGNLTLTGSTGGSGSAGSRIGGLPNGSTNLALTVHGAITLNGVAAANGGAALGPSPNSASPQNASLNVSADADITLNGGSVAGSRIGQPAGLIGGGDISIVSGGNISLAGTATSAGNIRTTGNVALRADSAGKSITQSTNSVILANGLTASANSAVNLLGANQINAFDITSGGNVAFNSAQSLTFDANSGITTPVGAQTVTISTSGATSDLTVSGLVNGSDDNYVLASAREVVFPLGSTVQGSGNVSIAGGTFAWSGSTFAGTGALTTPGTTNITGPVALNTGTWNNSGIVNESGAGRVTLGGSATINNQAGGTWNLNGSDPTPFSGSGSFNNAGTLNNNGGAASRTLALPVTNSGRINVNAGTLVLPSFPTNAGTISLGTGTVLSTNGASLTNSGTGVIMGNGTIALGGPSGGTLTNDGTVAPGASPGTLVVDGNFTQSASGTLAIEIGGTTPGATFDVLQVNGTANLGGTLDVAYINGFTPTPGNTFEFLTYATSIGDFANAAFPSGSVSLPGAPGPTAYEFIFPLPLSPLPPLIAEQTSEVVLADQNRMNQALPDEQAVERRRTEQETVAEQKQEGTTRIPARQCN